MDENCIEIEERDAIKKSLIVKVCDCYVSINRVPYVEDREEGVETEEEVSDDDDITNTEGSLVNETGSCEDENETCNWDESMFEKNDSIYKVTMPNSFHELLMNKSVNTPDLNNPKQHRRNQTMTNFDSVINMKDSSFSTVFDERNSRVSTWLNSSGNVSLKRNKTPENCPDDSVDLLTNQSRNIDDRHVRKIHPKYEQTNCLEHSNSKKRKRVSIVEEPEFLPVSAKKVKTSHKGFFSSLTGWICDLFK